jgi:4-hydroxyphenylpyruvate dioxygenase
MMSDNGNMAIPLNEDKSDKGQIAQYLKDFNGEGVQHIALHTDDIYSTVKQLKAHGMKFLDIPDTYYDMIDDRIDHHEEDIDALRESGILIDGSKEDGILLQIFTKEAVGPVFFEIIQRKGNTGFGHGNFKALFEAIERTQLNTV